MIEDNTLIAPLALADIASALGSSSTDYGTLCTHPSISMWAKYKPEYSDLSRDLTDEERRDLGYSITAQSYDVNENYYLKKMLDDSLSGAGWVYNRPSVSYRPNDFLGYYIKAECPFYVERVGAEYDLHVGVGQYQGLNEGNIQVGDLTALIGYDINSVGYGFVYRPSGSDDIPTHVAAIDSNGDLAYPLMRNGLIQDYDIPLLDTPTPMDYDVCCYITAKDRDTFYILPPSGITVTVKAKPAGFELTEFYAYAPTPAGTWSYTFTITAESSIAAKNATVAIYDWSNKVLHTTTFAVGAMNNGDTYTNGENNLQINPQEVGFLTLKYNNITSKTMIDFEDNSEIS